jgi:hypothetical protein
MSNQPIYNPRRTYFELLHVLSIAIPDATEKVLNDFVENLKIKKDEIPEVTRRLMSEAISNKIRQLESIKAKLLELKGLLEVDEG